LVDLVTALVAGGAGLAAGAVVSYLVFYSRPRGPNVKTVVREPSGSLAETTISASSLDKSKREMRALMLERDLLSSALMKVYEAETDGRITKEEREMIAKKYSDQIKELQSKLKDVELVVEVGELEALREELVSMFQQKIQNLGARLDQARERLGTVAPQAAVPAAVPGAAKKDAVAKSDKGTELEKVVEKRAKPELSESEKRVKEIRNEVMEALTKLERIDVEKKQQET
jgi:folate-dependent phosphoribosylglycinamide formyltransferase PurN